jgi:hypothetical protein
MFITGNKYKIMVKFGGHFHWNWVLQQQRTYRFGFFKIRPKENWRFFIPAVVLIVGKII